MVVDIAFLVVLILIYNELRLIRQRLDWLRRGLSALPEDLTDARRRHDTETDAAVRTD